MHLKVVSLFGLLTLFLTLVVFVAGRYGVILALILASAGVVSHAARNPGVVLLIALSGLVGYFIAGREGVILFVVFGLMVTAGAYVLSRGILFLIILSTYVLFSISGDFWVYLLVAVALCVNLFFYFFSHRLVLRRTGAIRLDLSRAPGLNSILEALSRKAGIRKPEVYLLPNPQPNSLTAGRSRRKSVLILTTGLIEHLTPEEITGVLGHEIAHVRAGDLFTATLAAAVSMGLLYLAVLVQGIFTGGDPDGEDLLFAALVLPLIARLIQLAISRAAEYAADAEGARLTRPEFLASALERIASIRIPGRVDPAIGHLFTVNPSEFVETGGLFSTHPPVGERIARLRAMSQKNSQPESAFRLA